MEKWKPLHIAGGNVEWYRLGEEFLYSVWPGRPLSQEGTFELRQRENRAKIWDKGSGNEKSWYKGPEAK